MVTTITPYNCKGTELNGYLVHDDSIHAPRPAIIIAHAWRGLDDFAKAKAEELAKMGYVAFAADLYGIKTPAKNDEEAGQRMLPLFIDRQKLQERMAAAFHFLTENPLVDAARVGAIGFCFGGLAVIELLRSGCPVRGVVSFHGVLTNHLGETSATTVPIAKNIQGSLLMLNGHDDPLFTKADIAQLEDEFTAAKVDWTFVDYGHTSHAFTNPEATNAKSGMVYQERSAHRAWAAMLEFFDEVLA